MLPLVARNWLAWCMTGVALLSWGAFARGRPEDLPWYWGQVLLGIALVAFGATAAGRRVVPPLVTGAAIALPILVFLEATGALVIWASGGRVQLFTENPNLLAAGLVALVMAAVAVRPSWWWVMWLPVVAMAVGFTGSRTGALALALGVIIQVVHALVFRPARKVGMVGAGILVVAAGFLVVAVRGQLAHPNLLVVSSTFDHPAWSPFRDATVKVEPSSVPGPYPQTRGDRISARTVSHPGVFLHHFGRSLDGTTYVASIYLRSEEPQQVVLSSGLSQVTCEVDHEWHRCETPPGRGDGTTYAQFRLWTSSAGQDLRVFAYGPQFEWGSESASQYVARSPTWFERTFLPDRRSFRASVHDLLSERVPVFAAYWRAFRTNPLFGASAPQSGAVTIGEASATVAASHAHNLLLDRVAKDGLIGLLGWLAVGAPLGTFVARRASSAVFAWISALVVLNTLDATFFHNLSFFANMLTAGFVASRAVVWTDERVDGAARVLASGGR